MLLEQEIASIITFALHYADNPSPYYNNVPQNFNYPAMFFPQPEIVTAGDTFSTYAMRYAWYINTFCVKTEEAFELAWKVLTAIKRKRNLIPLIGDNGEPDGTGLRLDDPSIKPIEAGVVQLTLSWTSRRPYDREDVQKMVEFEVKGWRHPDIYDSVKVETAFKNAIERCLMDYPKPKYAQE